MQFDLRICKESWNSSSEEDILIGHVQDSSEHAQWWIGKGSTGYL